MKLDDLLKNLEYTCIQGSIDGMEVSGIAYDSRKASEGDLFVCISGAVADGHSFAREVADKGVSVIVAEKPVDVPGTVTVIQVKDSRIALAGLSAEYFGNPAKELITIGITGTKGKTTTTYMIRSVLEASGIKTGLIGTIETIIGEKHIPSSNTTPESYIIQKTFREMADAGCKCVVMEVSSQGLMLHRTGGFTFDYGIFTN
ncbi:MAG: UDP-N-acetylmuramoyl-L-alanyl-D-glutamate--2,6-diaminopimelate ligase, partial [Lachnospiraceae bacterium]